MGLISRVLWTLAIGSGLLAMLFSIESGRTPFTERLFAMSLVTGLLGILADRARAGAR